MKQERKNIFKLQSVFTITTNLADFRKLVVKYENFMEQKTACNGLVPEFR